MLAQQPRRALHVLARDGLVARLACCRLLAAQAHATAGDWPSVLAVCAHTALRDLEKTTAPTAAAPPAPTAAGGVLPCTRDVLGALYLQQGLAHEALENREAAAAAYQAALRHDPGCSEAAERLLGQHMLPGADDGAGGGCGWGRRRAGRF